MLLRKTQPVYPTEAKLAGTQGMVQLSEVIGRDGNVIEVTFQGGEPALAQAAIEAVRQWVYRPTLLNGQPMEVETRVDVNFQLN